MRARVLADPRYLGQVQATLARWWGLRAPPPDVLLLRGAIEQSLHAFAAARADLDALIVVRPGDTRAHLTRAVVATVTGDYAAARSSCEVVARDADPAVMLAEVVQLMGYSTHVAHDGAAALALVQAGVAPAVALLDIGLPVMDGYELARRLRELPGWKRVHLIAITGYGQETDLQQSRDAGFDEHFVKPISLPILRESLERIRTGLLSAPAATTTST